MAEDRRIALAALAVAAIVPIAVLIFSSKHDSNQRHAQQVQLDRAELREVLDDAATALDVTLTRFERVEIYPTASPRRVVATLNTELSAIKGRLDGLERSYNRVAIRLGRRSEAAQEMGQAVSAARAAHDALVVIGEELTEGSNLDPRRLARAFSNAQDERNNALRRMRRFVDAANRVARSTTAEP